MSDDKPTHTVTITVTGHYSHGPAQHAQIALAGDGGLDHMLDAFKAALVAAGFAMATAAQLDIKEDGDE